MNLFDKQGYCIVKNVISNDLLNILTQYALFDEMQTEIRGDDQVPNAHSKYADPAMESMLLHLQKIIESHTNLSLYPTYSYYRVYRPGDILNKHTDREACEISATMCLNYEYDDKEYHWPIFMDNKKIVQNPGDIVIYKGCEIEHYRPKFSINNDQAWQVQGFFHYVDAYGKFSNHKFDKRETIGMKYKSIKSPKPYIVYTS
jgi:hypothetical protein